MFDRGCFSMFFDGGNSTGSSTSRFSNVWNQGALLYAGAISIIWQFSDMILFRTWARIGVGGYAYRHIPVQDIDSASTAHAWGSGIGET